MDTEILASFWMAQVLGTGPAGKEMINRCFGSGKKLFLASADEIEVKLNKMRFSDQYKKKNNDLNNDSINIEKRHHFFHKNTIRKMLTVTNKTGIPDEYERIMKSKIRFIRKEDAEYPDRLKGISNPPEQLFVIGRLPAPDRIAIGVVGARDCSAYGRDMARLFSFRLAQAGIAVISGMAIGIDGWSHVGALEAEGETYAVLGSGVEVCYPPSNEKLYHRIPQRGGLISEVPTNGKPLAANFPMRNRIISGLSDGILVVEARVRSGSLITADAALEQGKDVFVIPGRIGDELSVGCNRLIRQGAIPVLSPTDILEYYNVTQTTETLKEEGLSEPERKIIGQIGAVPVSLSEIADAARMPFSETLRILTDLKKNRRIRETSRNRYIRI